MSAEGMNKNNSNTTKNTTQKPFIRYYVWLVSLNICEIHPCFYSHFHYWVISHCIYVSGFIYSTVDSHLVSL